MGTLKNTLKSSLLAAALLVALPAARGDDSAAGVAAASAQVSQNWETQYQELAKDIAAGKSGQLGSSPHIFDRQALVWPADGSAAGIVIRRTTALLKHIHSLPGTPDLKAIESRLAELQEKRPANEPDAKALYLEACKLRRELALSNPLLDFDEMVFVTKRSIRQPNETVLTDWDYGYSARPGGGLFRVSGFKQGRPQIKNILENSVVASGRLNGARLGGGGAFSTAALDYDGETIVFAYVEKTNTALPWPREVFESFTKETCFHLFRVKADGAGLVQLTDGKRNDYTPCFLPGGRIVFVSDRRNVMARCQGGTPFKEGGMVCGTMHSMKPDGSDLICISYHETAELQPSVDNNGMLVYTRWDYVDRDFNAAHGLWTCYPDGRDPRAPHGNYPYPHHMFDGKKWKDGRADRPWAEYGIRAIPGSRRYIAVAGKHHISGPFGALVLIDAGIEDDNKMSQVTLFHNHALPDEGAGHHGDMDKGLPPSPMYTDPWPLSEEYVLAVQGNTAYLIDKFGNKDLLFSVAPADCGGLDNIRSPLPLQARRRPVVLPTLTNQGERYGAPDHKRATIAVMNVYESDFEWPPNTRISAIRVMQLFPFPWHSPFRNQPRIGPADDSNARAVLGVVPVEKDGSAYFEAPVEKAIYFQALDENGMAVQSMRSVTYVHPGEQMTCLGCHEKKVTASARNKVPMALKRPPSKLVPNLEDGSCPLTYARLVEPLLKGKCISCHAKNNKPAPNLDKYAFYFNNNGKDPAHGGYRTIAGRFGAIHTGLAEKMLMKQHREALTMAEINRITLWADANSSILGAYRDVDKQKAGEVVWPMIDMDPANPAGIDLAEGRPPPPPGATTPLMKQSEDYIKAHWPDVMRGE